jgi:hypothetical protein
MKAPRNGDRIHNEPAIRPPMNSTDSVIRARSDLDRDVSPAGIVLLRNVPPRT